MTYVDAIILGLIQGLTEFLPVSSSGHLVLTEQLLGVNDLGVSFEILVHVGSLLAVLVAYRVRLWRMIQSLYTPQLTAERRSILYLIIGTIPAVIAGVLLAPLYEKAFESEILTSAMLLATGTILLTTKVVRFGSGEVKSKSALLMGIGQALAILPGISRSGTTIATGMIAGVQPSKATDFSFLLAIPAITGALVFKFSEFSALDSAKLGPYLVGALISFVTSLIAVYTVLSIVRKGKFYLFGPYCLLAGGLGLYLFL